MRILWINPIGTDALDEIIRSGLVKVKRSETVVTVVSLNQGKPLHLEYHSYEALVAPDIIQVIREADTKGFDAAIIGCFYDTALREAREVSQEMIVVGPCQAAISTAVNFGNTFSILVGRRKWIPRIRENVFLYGYGHRAASIRPLGLSVDDIDKKYDVTLERMILEGKLAIEQDGAEVIVLGCTAADKYAGPLQRELNVPVVDSFVAPFKYAEMLSDLALKLGLFPSQVLGNEPPPFDDLDRFLRNR